MSRQPNQAELDTIIRNLDRVVREVSATPGGGSVRVGHPDLDTAVLVVRCPHAFSLISGMSEQLEALMTNLTGAVSKRRVEAHQAREDEEGPSLN